MSTLTLGYAFTTTGDIGSFQESEVTNAAWYRLDEAAHLVGPRVRRARDASVRIA